MQFDSFISLNSNLDSIKNEKKNTQERTLLCANAIILFSKNRINC